MGNAGANQSKQDFSSHFFKGANVVHFTVNLAGLAFNEHPATKTLALALLMLGAMALIYSTLPSKTLKSIGHAITLILMFFCTPIYFLFPFTDTFYSFMITAYFIFAVALTFLPLVNWP